MKKVLFSFMLVGIILLTVLACAEVTMDASGAYVLEPGLYQVGKDIPAGRYDVRFKNMEEKCIIKYSDLLDKDKEPDLTFMYSYSFEFTSKEWWQGVAPVIMVNSMGYLKIEESTAYLYAEK